MLSFFFPSLLLRLFLVASIVCYLTIPCFSQQPNSKLLEEHHFLRSGTGRTDSFVGTFDDGTNNEFVSSSSSESSNCNMAKDEMTCQQTIDTSSKQSCVWCTCQTIPSECLSPSQASQLPPSILDCTSTTTTNDEERENQDIENNDDSNDEKDDTFVFYREYDDDDDDNNNDGIITLVSHSLYDHGRDTDHDDDDDDDNVFCDVNSYSGYFTVKGSRYDANDEDKHLFYWMFEKRNSSLRNDNNDDDSNDDDDSDDDDIPFIIWLTGGPGCSSTLALLSENGPCTVSNDGQTTKRNPYSWTNVAHVLWLDQPAGVGFSYGKKEDDVNEQMIAEDVYWFLQAYFTKNKHFDTNPLYIVGESYGGHYAPAIAHRIWKGNQQQQRKRQKTTTTTTNTKLTLNLSGLAVGNGLTNPEIQYQWYAEMAYNNSHHIKAIDEQTYEAMQQVIPKCTALIHKCNEGTSMIDDFACQAAFVVCNMGLTSPYQMTGLNPYDIRKACEVPPLCYDFSNVNKFMNRDSTRRALHVSDRSPSWQSCNMGINLKFHVDWMKDFSPYVADLLNANIPALIYAGDVDFICNYLGNRAWTLALDWKFAQEFQAASDKDWNNGSGLIRSAHGFTFLQVYDAGHMVPSDQPEVALEMIASFLNGTISK